MSGIEQSSSTVHTDPRGTLIATELSDVPFAVTRIFVVRGPDGGAVRGDHVTNSAELLVLVSGTVTVFSGIDAEHVDAGVTLSRPGARILLEVGHYVRYFLPNAESEILVLCEQPFVSRS
ncbi:MAG: WxcM-like, C-terminal [Actinomycetota bacterium]|jgi:hypothetical protein|nr:WxcM-like, C-terminal [Actinomycetota bacterium]MDQ1551790.1 WxcM-like, C-terminal [Actinomycetota bacterium]